MTPDVNIVLLNLPTTTSEAITENPDGSFTIVLNAKMTHEKQLESYEHAMEHIRNNDFERNDVQSIEYAAHNNIAPEEMPKPVPAEKYIRKLRREQRALQKKIEEHESLMRHLNLDNDILFRIAENQYLYGGDVTSYKNY